ncbi:BCAM0308 family protein [Geobacter sp. DSM 9736]|uniref:BCAM0308 family protein n=1 Tax=Geobacter sp. DSM 9736 TaxID=1277350 RepID=UPI000B512150|nr:BCAM0308 family protein [Geobacter sp. DSM 9736]SNB45806.1 hypothetical protein SAMN06269301_1235 [Geobacter sp. DSM 9736]
MTPRGHRISMEEKGQRATRSTDVYHTEATSKQAARCSRCKAIYWNKRWYLDEEQFSVTSRGVIRHSIVCPACQRMLDNNPAGIATFRGDYLIQHEDEILNTIKNTEKKSRMKNPLSRIMEVVQEGNVLTISTSDDKLAQKIGRDVFKAHSGDLQYLWSHEHNFVRVLWSRQQ